jgi:hypothetical protein
MIEPKITREEFSEHFIAEILRCAGPGDFADGQSVEEYTKSVADSYFNDPEWREYGPEDCGQGELECWGD